MPMSRPAPLPTDPDYHRYARTGPIPYEVRGVDRESVVRKLYEIATASNPTLEGHANENLAAVKAARELRKLGLLGAPAPNDGGDA